MLGQHDIAFYPESNSILGFKLYRGEGEGAIVSGATKGSETDAPTDEISLIMNDWSGGMGYTRASSGGVANGYSYCVDVDARDPRILVPAGRRTGITLPSQLTKQITSIFELNSDDLFVVSGQYVARIPLGTGNAQFEKDLGSGFTAGEAVIWAGTAYIGASSNHNLWQYDGIWTQSTDCHREKFTSVYWTEPSGRKTQFLVATSSSSAITWLPLGSSALVNANWRSSISVGDTNYAIQRLVASNQHVYVVKTDGVHDLLSDGSFPQMTPWVRRSVDSRNGLAAQIFDGYLYFSHTLMGMARIDISSARRQDRPEACPPGYGLPNETPISGEVTDMEIDPNGGWLVVSVYNGTDSFICYGVDRATVGVNGIGPMLWHGALTYIPGERVDKLYFAHPQTGSPRLWIASTATPGSANQSPRLYWVSVPHFGSAWQDHLTHGEHRFAPDGALYCTTADWGDPNANKSLVRYDVRADNVGPESYWSISVAADDDIHVGHHLASGSSFQDEGHASDEASTIYPTEVTTGREVMLRLGFVSAHDEPPALRSVRARANVMTDLAETFEYTVVLAEYSGDAPDWTGQLDLYRSLLDLSNLGPIPFRDHNGDHMTVKVGQNIRTQERRTEEGPARWAMIARVPITIYRRDTRNVATWGAGDQYGGFEWQEVDSA